MGNRSTPPAAPSSRRRTIKEVSMPATPPEGRPPQSEPEGVVAELREANERLVIAGIQLQQIADQADRSRVDAEEARRDAESASHAKDEFVAAVSHELRTPLNAVMGWVHLLRQATVSAETVRRGLEVIDRNTKLLARLLADLLQVSEII